MDDWTELTEWWRSESQTDPYAEEVVPLFLKVLEPTPGGLLLDLGCGEGQMSRKAAQHTGATVIGVDVNPELAGRAARHMPVVLCRLPDLSCIKSASVQGAFAVLVLEHIADRPALFAESARVVCPGGSLSIVINHPVYTAPDSGPILDPTDGEIFWRFGDYLTPGITTEPAGEAQVTFHHLPLGMLLTRAAQAGWCLEKVREQGVGERAAARDPILARHGGIPHLLAVRWRRDKSNRRHRPGVQSG